MDDGFAEREKMMMLLLRIVVVNLIFLGRWISRLWLSLKDDGEGGESGCG